MVCSNFAQHTFRHVQLSGRDIQHLVLSEGIAPQTASVRSKAASKLVDSSMLSELQSVQQWGSAGSSAVLVSVASGSDFRDAVQAAKLSEAQMLLVAVASQQQEAQTDVGVAACSDSDRTGLRVTASIVEGLGITLLLGVFTALGLAALYCVASPTRLLEKNVPVGREH